MMDPELKEGFRLGTFEVHPLRNEIVGSDGPVHVPPRVMDVLLRLAADAGEVVTRQTLLDDVWDGVVVSDETLSRAISDLRSVLQDRAGQPGFIQTVPKRGYRLVAPVERLRSDSALETGWPDDPAPRPAAPPRPVPRPRSAPGPRPIRSSSPTPNPDPVPSSGAARTPSPAEHPPPTADSTGATGLHAPAAPSAAVATPGPAVAESAPTPATGDPDSPLSLWYELKRRNVFRVGAAYGAVAWLIIEVATTVQDYVGLEEAAVRLIVITLAIGLPIALALAWAFEVTPEGILYDKSELVQNQTAHARKLRRLDAVTILTITIAISVFVYRSLTLDGDDGYTGGPESPPPAAPPPTLAAQSIAVMPFVDLSEGEDKGYFADGLAEELIALLGRSSSLRVVPRTASFYYKNKDVEMTTIAERLRVNHILEGSVRVGDDRVRVLATLSDARSATLLWSESFEIAPAGIFDVQDTIATAVAEALAIQLDIGTSETAFVAPTPNVGAYEFYLRGLEYLNRPKTRDNLSAAEALFQRALDIDPQYGRAYAGLCETHLGFYVMTSDVKSFEAAERACHRALTLDRSQDGIYLALGQMYRHSGQYDAAIRELRAAVARHPNRGVGHMELGMALADAGEPEEAERELRLGVELEPGYWGGYTALGYFLYQQGRYEEALSYYQVTVELTPDNASGYNNLAAAYYMLDDYERAADAYEASLALEPTRSAYTNTGLMYYYTGRFAAAVEMQRQAVELAPEDHRVWGRLAESARFATGMEEQSEPAYRRAYELAADRLRINPRDANTVGHLALYAAHLGEHAEAAALLQRGFDLDRDDADMHYFAALVAIEGGDIPRAYEHLVRSIELGFSTTLIQADPDIAPLIENSEFRAVLAERGNAAGSP